MHFSCKYLISTLYLLTFILSNNTNANELSVMSWNVYFDDISGQSRYPKIIDTISKHQADIICLQEATDSFIKKITNSSLRQQYQFINISGSQQYRNIILTKIKETHSGIIKLPTNMNRLAVYINLKINNNPIQLINVHLDSMTDDTELRIEQLQTILGHDKTMENLILCGDLNFGDDDKENKFTIERFKDSAGNNKTTSYNVTENKLARKTKFMFEESRRLDRILVRGKMATKKYQLFSYPYSDHYPILSTIQIN